MDLMHDWKALNEVLFHNQRIGPGLASKTSSMVLVENEGRIIDGVASNGRRFTDAGMEAVSSNKERLDNLAAKYGTEQVVVLSKRNLDQYIIEAASLGPNYFQQLQLLRKNVVGDLDNPGAFMVSRRHFVLDLFGQYLRRTLPKRFNVVVFIDERASGAVREPVGHDRLTSKTPVSYRAIVLSYVNGQVDQFYEPDFSSLHEGRLRNWQHEAEAIGQYLETRYMLPCYAIFMGHDDWIRCLDSADQGQKPWRHFVRYYDSGRAAVYPNGFVTKALLALQRAMVYFGRA